MLLKDLDNTFKMIFDGYAVSPFITYSKVLGCLIVIVVLANNLFKSFSRTGIIFTPRESDGFSPYELLRGIGLILLISLSTQFLDIFDNLMVDVETIFSEHIEVISADYRVGFFPDYSDRLQELQDSFNERQNEERGLLSWLEGNVNKITQMLNPFQWIGGAFNWALNGLLNVIEMFIYPFFLTKRYFIMGIVKLMFPLTIALSIFDKTRDYIINIMKIYARAYFTIIPMMFVSYFTAVLHSNLHTILGLSLDVTHAPMVGMPGSSVLISSVLIIVMVIIKTKLYKESFNLMEQLIP